MPEKTFNFQPLEKALSAGHEQLFARVDAELTRFRQGLLMELANLDISDRRLERTLTHFERESDRLFANAQQSLRDIWPRSVSVLDKQKVVDAWLAGTKRAGRAGVTAWLGRGRLEFDFQSFPGQFVTAILENWWRFQVCANPDCPARYFLANRSTQRLCERGECTRYSQRQHALNYWRTKGKLQRTKRTKGAK